jgi:hypothetical protein
MNPTPDIQRILVPHDFSEPANRDTTDGAQPNYLTVGQIYRLANPLLKEPLRTDHIKSR